MTKQILITFVAILTFTSCQPNKKTNGQEVTNADSTAITVKGQLVMGHESDVFTPFDSKKNFWIVDASGELKKAYESLTLNAKKSYTPIFAEIKVADKGKSTEGFAAQYDGVYEVIKIITTRNLSENEAQSIGNESKDGITIEEFVTDDGKSLTAVYNTGGEKPTVTITYGEYKDQVLIQTTAWAKGAEYENKNMRWTSNPEGGKLKVKNKTVSFKFKK